MKFMAARFKNWWVRTRLRGKELAPAARRNLQALDGIDLSRQARECRYVIVDLETTGLDLRRDQVLSVGAFRMTAGRIILREMFDYLVNPGHYIPPESIKIHGIVPDMVSEARPIGEVLDEFLVYAGSDILVGHWIRFDLHFINQVMMARHGFPIQNLVLDTVPLCRQIAFPPHHHYPYGINLENQPASLDAIAKHFGIDIHERHTAIGDALATAMVFQRVLARLEQNASGQLKDLVKAGAVF